MALFVGEDKIGVVNGIISTRMWLERKDFLQLVPLRSKDLGLGVLGFEPPLQGNFRVSVSCESILE